MALAIVRLFAPERPGQMLGHGQDPKALGRSLPTPESNGIVILSRRDSDLEAFSHNPSDGSVAPLVYRPST